KLANGVKEYVEDFMSGFAGHGWKLWEYIKGKWMLEIDAIRVRGQFTIFELLVSKIRAIIGAQTITQGCGKIKTVGISEDGAAYLITLEDTDMSFMEHDFIRCQEFTGNQRLYHVEIESIVDGVIHIPVSEFESEVNEDGITFVTNPPMPGDDIVQFGNSSYEEQYAGRHSAIYMHADESGQPAIDVLDGIYTKDWSNCLKVRMGGDIPGTAGLKGFYCVNGMLKAVDEDGTILYQFNPDSSGFIAKGNIRWDKDGNGDIFNRAIYWDKGGFHFGSGVKLTWDNLDSETKENLKGEPGRDGNNGADGINGEDGTSLVYKGEFTSHPSNPQNGWYYRNISDKKTYVYQDNAWYVMTVDGSDGKDGLDGINGEDGKDGLDIVWKGDSSIPPANPQKNWVYRDTDNGRVYIYNGTAWALMVADGNDGIDGTDGKDGMRVYITYHDSEAEPAKPTGRGTSDGWHTNATNAVVWISQKVSESADSGEWGDPIRLKGKPGKDANLLPWIEEWDNNKTQIGSEYIISPKMFAGTNTGTSANPTLTGVAIGRGVITINGVEKTGLFGLKNGKLTFEIDAETGDAVFRGKIETQTSGSRIVIDPVTNSLKMYNTNDWAVFSLSFIGDSYNAYPQFVINGVENGEYSPGIVMTGRKIEGSLYYSKGSGLNADTKWKIDEDGISHFKDTQGFSLTVDLNQTYLPGMTSLHLTRFAPGFLPGYSTAKNGEVYVTSDGTLKIKGYSVES
ncbi:MAG: hypothetical protein ACLS72_24435, partial [Bacteroides ovatus]